MSDARDGAAGRIVLDGDGSDGTSVSCFGLWLRQRRRGVTSGATGQLERFEDAQSAADRDARDRRVAVDAWAACSLGDDHPAAAFLGRSHPGTGQILASGRLARHASTGAPIYYCLPASQATGLPSCCLCTNMWITCAQRRRACAYAVEMLGIPLPGRNHDRASTWESASRILWMQRKPELSTCHAAIDN